MIFIFYLFVENEVCEIIVVINYDPTLSRQVNRFPSSILLAAKFWHLLNSSNFVLNVFGVWEREFLINYQIFWWFSLKVIKKEDILFLAISSSPPNFFVTYFLSFLQSIYLLFLSFNMLTTFSANLPLYIDIPFHVLISIPIDIFINTTNYTSFMFLSYVLSALSYLSFSSFFPLHVSIFLIFLVFIFSLFPISFTTFL